jgi:transposase-like protein
MTMKQGVIRYSEAFKLKVVSEFEAGKFRTYKEGHEAYGIKGSDTLRYWLKKYGKTHLLPRIVRVETANEKDQLKLLKKEISQLKEAVADSKVQELIHRAAFEVVCEKYGLGVPEAVKKNSMFNNG